MFDRRKQFLVSNLNTTVGRMSPNLQNLVLLFHFHTDVGSSSYWQACGCESEGKAADQFWNWLSSRGSLHCILLHK